LGADAMYSNTTGLGNTATGASALTFNTIGSFNTANGYSALGFSKTGIQNTAIGAYVLNYNSSGSNNTASGYQSLPQNDAGSSNTANGAASMYFNTEGNNNVAVGSSSLHQNITGNNNTALGQGAGYLSSGDGNVFIGNQAGFSERTGSNKFYVGNDQLHTLLYGDFSTGQVLLGNLNPTGYVFAGTRTLNVTGGVLADSIRLAPSDQWADFVFDSSYALPSLGEVGAFVKEKRHLPGIPSAGEVAVSGVSLGEMNQKLLQKVEELTLYLIQQQKEIAELKSMVKELAVKK
ncbi:MAG TPA: hypothetical protein VKQ52_11075, partial [Puia sp.]|nr:hypothetical protein [Puia sp.]